MSNPTPKKTAAAGHAPGSVTLPHPIIASSGVLFRLRALRDAWLAELEKTEAAEQRLLLLECLAKVKDLHERPASATLGVAGPGLSGWTAPP